MMPANLPGSMIRSCHSAMVRIFSIHGVSVSPANSDLLKQGMKLVWANEECRLSFELIEYAVSSL